MTLRAAQALVLALIGLLIMPGLAGAVPAATTVPTPPAGTTTPPAGTAPSRSSAPGATGTARPRATWGIGPVTTGKASPRAYFSYQMGVGGSYADKVALVNFGAQPVDLTVFAADLGNGEDGSVAAGPQSARPADAGGWVHLALPRPTVRVPASTHRGPGRVEVPFRIAVPQGAAPGDHAAVIVASLSTLGKNPRGENVRLNQQLGTRIYLRVTGALRPHLVIDSLRVDYHASLNPFSTGTATISYTVRNDGNVRLGGTQRVTVSGLFGTSAKVAKPADIALLFPGGSQTVRVRASGIHPTFRERVTVTVTPTEFADQTRVAAPVTVRSVTFAAVPWTSLAALAGLLVMVVGSVILLRRRRRAGGAGRGGRHGRPRGGPAPDGTPTRPVVSSGASR